MTIGVNPALVVLRPEGQKNDMVAAGACDLVNGGQANALVPFRFDTVFIRFVHAAFRATFEGRVTAFAAGIDDNDTTIGALNGGATALKKTAVETDVYASGAMARAYDSFRAVGLSIAVERPFTLGPDNERDYAPWLDEYEQRAREACIQGLGVSVTFGGAKMEYYLGKPADWGQDGGACGPVVTNGTPVTGQIAYFTSVLKSGPKDAGNKAVVNLFTGAQALCLPDNAGQPPVADIIVPVRVKLYGEGDSGCEPICAPPGVSQAQIEQALRRILAGTPG